MPYYEHVFLARQDVSASQAEELATALGQIITENGGSIGKTEYWGLKSLQYRIRKNRKAHFTMLNIDAPAAALTEMERQERINEDILRFLTVRVDALEEGPSAMMQQREERSDRGERRGPRRF
jgi:small subunit ribosomal protein S6